MTMPSERYTPEELRDYAADMDNDGLSTGAAMIRQAAEDFERLDWLMRHPAISVAVAVDGSWTVRNTARSQYITGGHKTYQDAIDTARRTQEKKT